jgi:hypothetical protein
MRQHDEDTIRTTWRGCSWLGVESIHAPKHGKPKNLMLLRGSFDWTKSSTVQKGGGWR